MKKSIISALILILALNTTTANAEAMGSSEEATIAKTSDAATDKAKAVTKEVKGAIGDVKKGKKVAKKCAVCHTFDQGGKNKVGPNLFGIIGKGVAEVEGFKYSKVMLGKKGNTTWDAANLSDFLKKPKKWAPKTKMAFPGLKKDKDRANIISYLETLK